MWSFQSLHALIYAVTQSSLSPKHRNKQRKTHDCRGAWTSQRANDCVIMTRECFHVTLLKNDLAVALPPAILHLLLCWFLVEFCSPSLSSKDWGDISKVTSVCWAIEWSVSFLHTRNWRDFSLQLSHRTMRYYKDLWFCFCFFHVMDLHTVSINTIICSLSCDFTDRQTDRRLYFLKLWQKASRCLMSCLHVILDERTVIWNQCSLWKWRSLVFRHAV